MANKEYQESESSTTSAAILEIERLVSTSSDTLFILSEALSQQVDKPYSEVAKNLSNVLGDVLGLIEELQRQGR
ncbi:hypothetical protein ACQKDY_00520 [Alteromonas macleodii]|uniref:hypothetical protein n=1 Tax=Alteromonas macleodii TaxID=28108 RepID=UPI003D085ECD